ncbi:MAG TPA: hypothetical protein VIT91_14585 [Chthoniobacterales bacterium]
MKGNTNVEIEFPWRIEVLLTGAAMVASVLTVFVGWTVLTVIVNDSLEKVFAAMEGAPQDPISLGIAWLLLLVAFSLFAVRFYFSFRRVLVRRLPML